jgi:hypothetical protein
MSFQYHLIAGNGTPSALQWNAIVSPIEAFLDSGPDTIVGAAENSKDRSKQRAIFITVELKLGLI